MLASRESKGGRGSRTCAVAQGRSPPPYSRRANAGDQMRAGHVRRPSAASLSLADRGSLFRGLPLLRRSEGRARPLLQGARGQGLHAGRGETHVAATQRKAGFPWLDTHADDDVASLPRCCGSRAIASRRNAQDDPRSRGRRREGLRSARAPATLRTGPMSFRRGADEAVVFQGRAVAADVRTIEGFAIWQEDDDAPSEPRRARTE